MFVIAVLSFALGVYLEALYSFPPAWLFLALLVPLPFIPFLISRKEAIALALMIPLFLCAGMLRLSFVVTGPAPIVHEDREELYEGIIVEASPGVKILKIENPADLSGAKAAFKTAEALTINDRVKVFGQMRELALTFNNPFLAPWKWSKRLEGVSYEIKGRLISASPGRNFIHAWRSFLGKKIEASGSGQAAVIKALTIGDTTGLDEETKRVFRETGTSHILAISGSNIGIVTAFFFFIARFLVRLSSRLRQRGDDTRYAALLSIPFVIAFMITAGSSVPTIRAAIMITVFMLALFFERGKHAINTIALSALVILLVYPHSLFQPSFQLTFMSVLFIVICSERFYPMLKINNRIARWFASSVLVTAAATIGALPVGIYHFYGINPFSVVHNLIAVPPMCVVAMPVSLLGLVLPWGEYLLRFSGEVVDLTVRALRYLNMGYIYPVIRPTLFECMLYFSLILSIIHFGRRIIASALIFLLLPLAAGYSWYAYYERFHNRTLCVNFIDVGLGDAMLVEAPSGIRLLVDGGGALRGNYDVGKSVITPILLSRKILTLDYVINTHPHGDHLGGLFTVIKLFNVKHFVSGAYFGREAGFIQLLALLREKGLTLEIWKRGERHRFRGDMAIGVLNPGRDDSAENPNNASLVLKLTHGENSFLLTGDIDREVEEKLVLTGAPLRSNIMKIPHHGSRFSSSAAFVRTIKPDMAVLSVGKGIRGLPGDDALNTYRLLSVPVVRTDRDGFIEVCSDGRRVTCKVFRKNG